MFLTTRANVIASRAGRIGAVGMLEPPGLDGLWNQLQAFSS